LLIASFFLTIKTLAALGETWRLGGEKKDKQ
jgi:hypothetical protein